MLLFNIDKNIFSYNISQRYRKCWWLLTSGQYLVDVTEGHVKDIQRISVYKQYPNHFIKAYTLEWHLYIKETWFWNCRNLNYVELVS